MKNPTAFPRPGFATAHNVPYDDYFENRSQDGMTLRDYFAARALQCLWVPSAEALKQDAIAAFAGTAYQIADAMLKAREQ